jgi:hypothetical protein
MRINVNKISIVNKYFETRALVEPIRKEMKQFFH